MSVSGVVIWDGCYDAGGYAAGVEEILRHFGDGEIELVFEGSTREELLENLNVLRHCYHCGRSLGLEPALILQNEKSGLFCGVNCAECVLGDAESCLSAIEELSSHREWEFYWEPGVKGQISFSVFAKAIRLTAVERHFLKNQIPEAMAALMDALEISQEEAARQISVLRAALAKNDRGMSLAGFVRFDEHGKVVWDLHREN